jgi:omega-hydroxy-beta-dihydromenaquinone-9 sulfotransferase
MPGFRGLFRLDCINNDPIMINFALYEFTRRATCCGGISRKGTLLLIGYYLRMVLTIPFAFLQFLIFGNRIRKTTIPADPVFILGHYRSGTTYLQKLLVSDNRFGSLTNYDALFSHSNLLFGRKMQWFFQSFINLFRIKNPFFHNSLVQLSEPTEEDDYLINRGSAFSAYWGLIFPKRWREWLNGSAQFSNPVYLAGWKQDYLQTIRYATFKNHGRQLILKNPPNMERIPQLIQLFPQAKFIFIYRNPYVLYYSILNMWTKAVLSYYSVQTMSDTELEELAMGHFEYLNECYEKDKHLIPEGNLIEISYEELKADPFATIHSIYSRLNLTDFEATRENLLLQIELEGKYENFHHRLDPAKFKLIEARWGKYIHQGNYYVHGNSN